MIKIKKKVNRDERLKTLAVKLGYPPLFENYPHENDECWRRFSPEKVLTRLEEASEPDIHLARPRLNNNSPGLTLKSLAQWKNENEIFYRKTRDAVIAGAQTQLEAYTGGKPARFFRDFLVNRLADEIPVLVIEPGTTTEEPLELIWDKASDSGQNNSLELKGLIVVAGENSKATLLARHLAGGFDISLYRAELAAGSKLDFHLLYDMPEKEKTGICQIETTLEKSAKLKTGLYTPTVHHAKIFTESLLEENASADFYGVHAGNHSQVDHDYHIIHQGNRSQSNLYFKAALLDLAKAIFQGNTAILPGTSGCEGYQSNKNMLLGKDSRIDAIPKLEILTEDVSASHGSATGEISDEQMFYLMSRGLSRSEAQNLLLRGFFEDILHRALPGDETGTFKNELWEKINARLQLDSTEE